MYYSFSCVNRCITPSRSLLLRFTFVFQTQQAPSADSIDSPTGRARWVFSQKLTFKILILDKFRLDNNLTFLWFDNVKTHLQAKPGRKWVRIQPMRSGVNCINLSITFIGKENDWDRNSGILRSNQLSNSFLSLMSFSWRRVITFMSEFSREALLAG